MAFRMLVKGKLQHRGNFAFLIPDRDQSGLGRGSEGDSRPGAGRDVFVRGPSLRLAFDGDIVEVRVKPGRGRPEGEIVRVIEHGRKTAVGILKKEGGGWRVVAESGELNFSARVRKIPPGLRPKPGVLVVLRIVQWPTRGSEAVGDIVEMLGAPGAPGVRLKANLKSREIPEGFPPEVLGEAGRFRSEVDPRAAGERFSLVELPTFTIDGADAKDFDDAISIEPLGRGVLRLGVHIADVSHYVRPGSAIDREAYRRATSVYLPGKVVPMLPPNLSDHLCSLMPEVRRLTLSCFLDFDPSGKVLNSRFENTLIRSWKRFTYEDAERVLRGGKVPGLDGRVRESLLRMGPLAKRLTTLRMARGALDIDLPEFKIVMGAHGEVSRVDRVERLSSHRLIEEFMIAANEAAARHLKSLHRPFPSRIHPAPDPAKLAALSDGLREHGVPAPKRFHAKDVQGILRRLHHHPLRDILSIMVMRSLKVAVYSAKPGPHFGLASQAYCHFTSPIRRYPDLLTHRAIKGSGRWSGPISLEKACAHCSERERLAAEAERDSVDALRGRWLKNHPNRDFPGVITRVENYGVFVELTDTGAVGLVRGAKGELGAQVRVRIKDVNEAEGEVDLSLVSGGAGGERPSRHVRHHDRSAQHRSPRPSRSSRRRSHHRKERLSRGTRHPQKNRRK